jgi:hypothetical protein
MSDPRSADAIGKALNGKRLKNGAWKCRCPAHDDTNPSFTVSETEKGVVVHCHAGCSQDAVIAALRHRGLWPEGGGYSGPDPMWRMKERARKFNGNAAHAEPEPEPKPETWGPWQEVLPPYVYTDRNGTLLYQVIRKERFNAVGEKQKDFMQRRPDGKGGWEWKQGDRRVLYLWPDVATCAGAPLYVCEGEKDADRVAALGLCATTVANGNWNGVDVTDVTGRDVMVLEDADKPGVKKALAAAHALHHSAPRSIRIVRLPGHEHTADDHGKDVSDWLDADPARGLTQIPLADVCVAAPLWEPQEQEAPSLRYVDMSAWDSTPAPGREWAVEDRIPMRQAYLFSGHGAAGKSLVELMRAVAHVLGRRWLGMQVRKGPVIYLSAEDDKDELHRRLADILRHYDATFAEVIAAVVFEINGEQE